MRRRQFLRHAGLAASLATINLQGVDDRSARSETGTDEAPSVGRQRPAAHRICLFTDHLDDDGYSWSDVARMLQPLGIGGPDLTVRPGGLVKPEAVAEDLPRAVAAFRDAGLQVPMLTTAVTSLDDAGAADLITAAGKLGIGYCKLGYYHYHDAANWQHEIKDNQAKLRPLVELAREVGICWGLHNHAGPTIGGAVWDGWEFIRDLEPKSIGFYFDPAHATIEGANHGWRLNFHRVSSRLQMLAVKDFEWIREKGQWKTRWCPLGQGMVNWSAFFDQLVRIDFRGPISVHIEYDPGGSTRPEKIDNCLRAAQHDLQFLQQQLDRAYR